MKKNCALIALGFGGNSFDCQKAEILFKPAVKWAVDAALSSGLEEVCMAEDGITSLVDGDIRIVSGAGQDTCRLKDFLDESSEGNVLVLPGDAPFITADIIKGALALHEGKGFEITVISAGAKDCNGNDRTVSTSNSAYWIKAQSLMAALNKLYNKGEGYLPDMLTICLEEGDNVGTFFAGDECASVRVCDFKTLHSANEAARRRVLDKLMESGVEVVCGDGVMISPDVVIGKGTKILQGTIIRGASSVGENCVMGPNTLLEDTIVGNEVKLNAVQCYKSKVEDGVTMGPFVHIRPNSVICRGVKIGDFVEVKNSVVGAGTHISHLTYVGDSDVGENVNFGCGCVTVNYDGVKKSRCTIGNNVFLGCNTNLVAPVTLEDNAYTAAGSTITHNVPKDALAIARARQVNIEGWVERKRGKRSEK